jgi:hypothetical protein
MSLLWENVGGRGSTQPDGGGCRVKKLPLILIFVALSLPVGSPATAQTADPGGAIGSPLEVTKDGELIYGGDVVYECAIVGAGIVMPAENSSPETRAELERTNRQAIELCTEAGFPPAGTEADALPETGGYPPIAWAALAAAASFVLMRRFVR